MTADELLACLTDRPCEVCKFHTDLGCSKWSCVFEGKTEEWIPCEERLPEEGNTTYMVTVDYGEFGGGTGQRFYYGKDIGWDDDAVVAWMPLPKPYEGRME